MVQNRIDIYLSHTHRQSERETEKKQRLYNSYKYIYA